MPMDRFLCMSKEAGAAAQLHTATLQAESLRGSAASILCKNQHVGIVFWAEGH